MVDEHVNFCPGCGKEIKSSYEHCPYCGTSLSGAAGQTVQAQNIEDETYTKQSVSTKASSKSAVAAGVLAILLGSLGIHKFYLGYSTAGVTMLLVTLLTCGVGGVVMSIIGIVEGIIYLTKPEDCFYETYVINQKEWF